MRREIKVKHPTICVYTCELSLETKIEIKELSADEVFFGCQNTSRMPLFLIFTLIAHH